MSLSTRCSGQTDNVSGQRSAFDYIKKLASHRLGVVVKQNEKAVWQMKKELGPSHPSQKYSANSQYEIILAGKTKNVCINMRLPTMQLSSGYIVRTKCVINRSIQDRKVKGIIRLPNGISQT